MSLSKEQKTFAIEQLSSQFKTIRLMCDDYEISLKLERYKMKLIIGIYINDRINGSWFTKPEDHPEAKYLPIKRKAHFTSAQKKEIIKTYGKRNALKYFPHLNDVYEMKFPYFHTAGSAIAHLIKVSKSIELITEMAA